jgi:hypothetical protein
VVPAEFTGYFAAAATAAGVLIGLLFVAIALRPETIFGPTASADGRTLAGSSFTSLVNSFFVSLVALIPDSNLGEVAIIMAVISLYSTFRTGRAVDRRDLHVMLMLVSTGTYGYQGVTGVLLIIDQHSRGQVLTISYLIIASLAVALTRAWALLRGEHLSAAPGSPPDDEAAGDQAAGSGRAGQVAEPAQRAEQQHAGAEHQTGQHEP